MPFSLTKSQTPSQPLPWESSISVAPVVGCPHRPGLAWPVHFISSRLHLSVEILEPFLEEMDPYFSDLLGALLVSSVLPCG